MVGHAAAPLCICPGPTAGCQVTDALFMMTVSTVRQLPMVCGVLQEFSFELVPGVTHEPKLSVIPLAPANGLPIFIS